MSVYGRHVRRLSWAFLAALATAGAARTSLAGERSSTYDVPYNNRGERQGTIQGDGVTDRLVIYDNRGRRQGYVDPQPDYSKPTHPTLEDDIAEEHQAEERDR